jgi:hypothetical protein
MFVRQFIADYLATDTNIYRSRHEQSVDYTIDAVVTIGPPTPASL